MENDWDMDTMSGLMAALLVSLLIESVFGPDFTFVCAILCVICMKWDTWADYGSWGQWKEEL
jgi:hypothetical protein